MLRREIILRIGKHDKLFLCPHPFNKVLWEIYLKKKKSFFEHCFNDFESKEIVVVSFCCGFELCDVYESEEQL